MSIINGDCMDVLPTLAEPAQMALFAEARP